ncbi:MAG: TolC family protein [Magnetococcales bacterium]|nr:TolC family protein [Magnetococcales bacterium]
MRTPTIALALIATIALMQADCLAAAEESTPVHNVETRINQNLQTWADNSKNINAEYWQWEPVTPSDVVRLALQENISLKQQALNLQMANETLKEVKASRFDPVLSVSGTYSYSKTENRTETDNKYKKATTRCPQAGDNIVLDRFGSLESVILSGEAGYDATKALVSGDSWICLPEGNADYSQKIFIVFPTTSPVHYLRFDQVRSAGFITAKEIASEADPSGPESKTGTVALGVSKPLPWGLNLAVNQKTVHTKKKWVLNPSADSPTVGSYGRPWISSLDASVSLPIPGGKNFGTHSTREIDVKLAGMDNQLAKSDYQDEKNSLIQKVRKTFWNTVSAIRVLDATIKNRRDVELLVRKTQKLFDQHRVTSYEILQVKSELERVRGSETVAWNEYILASNTLSLLLNKPKSVLFMPVEYAEELDAFSKVGLDGAMQNGDKNNPKMHSKLVLVNKANVLARHGKNQARPDIFISGSVNASQSNSLFGYQTLGDSINHLLNPDKVTFTANLAWRYPWGNRSPKALLKKFNEQLAVSNLEQRITKNQIDLQIKNAHTNLNSALIRTAMSERQLKLTKMAYQKALRAQLLRRITEYEIIVKGGEVLNVEKQLILSQIAAKNAEIDLLTAMGTLAANLNNQGGDVTNE